MRKKPLDKISTYYADNLGLTMQIVISGLLFDGLSCLIPLAQGQAVGLFADGAAKEKVFAAAGVFVLLVLFVQCNRFWKRSSVRKFANRIMYSMREAGFLSILHYPRADLEKDERGDLLNRNIGDVTDAAEGIRKVTTEVFDSGVLILGYVISMFVMSPVITLIVTAAVVLAVISAAAMKRPVYKAATAYRVKNGEVKQSGIKIIENNVAYASVGCAPYYKEKYAESLKELEKKAVLNAALQEALQPVYQLVALLSVVFAVIVGVNMVKDGKWGVGEFTAYITTLLLVASKAGKVGKAFNAYQKAKVSFNRCKEFLAEPPKKNSVTLTGDARLTVKDATFGFNESCILSGVNLDIYAGIYAVTGVVHSGKTTFLELLSGLFPYEGKIELCGKELSSVAEGGASDAIGYAPQKPEIFGCSVRENILMGRGEDVAEAAALCCVDVPLDKEADHMGGKLSGGEKARIALARAVYGKPKLLLIDDGFAGLDVDVSGRIIKSLRAYAPDTIIIIATNQSEIAAFCDKEYRIEGGRINERS